MNRRILTLLIALVPLLLLGVLGNVVTVPFVVLGPGPTVNTLSEVDGKEVVEITGAEVDPTTGNLNMTTVSVRDGVTLFEAFGFWIQNDHGLVPRADVYPPDVPREEVEKNNQAEFAASEHYAEVAALHYLDLPVTVIADPVYDDGPAHGVLEAGDELLSIDGLPIGTSGDVVTSVAEQSPGTTIEVTYRRDGVEHTDEVVLGARTDDAEAALLGVGLRDGAEPPMRIDFNLDDIGGPSAGLMFSLAVIEKLTPGDLDGGKFIAGTGTIDPAGEVGPIGGIQYKMMAAEEAGAETFLVPAKNCPEAAQRTPEGLRLIKVENLDGAVQALEDLEAGRPVPGC